MAADSSSPEGPGPVSANCHSSSPLPSFPLRFGVMACAQPCVKYEKAKLIAKWYCCDRGTEKLV